MQLTGHQGPIVAIGGGELRRRETLDIDRRIVSLAGKERPNALFLPTASGEPWPYYNAFQRIYGSKLRCKASILRLLTADPSAQEIQDKILAADLIYVGGGNTARMLDAWREKGVDRLLLDAHQRGVVLSGLSAGAIAWFQEGHSDSFLEESGQYQGIQALGLIPAICCPHYNERPEFDEWILQQGLPAIALEDNSAILYQGGTMELWRSNDQANAYWFHTVDGQWVKQPLEEGVRYQL